MLHRLGLALPFCFLPLIAPAATVDAYLLGSVAMAGDGGGTLAMFDSFTVVPGKIEAIQVSDSRVAAASGNFGSGSAAAQYAFDGVTGQLKIGVNADVVAGLDGGRGATSAYAHLEVSEAFRIVGSGIVTVGMALSASWSSPSFFFTSSVGFISGITLPGITGSNDALSKDNVADGNVGSISEKILEVSFVAPEGTDGLVDFVWRLFGTTSAGGGYGPSESTFVNAMNTANIFVRTTGDVTATPVTAGFLSDPAYGSAPPPAVVPLPASGVLLMLALGGAGLARRRSKGHRSAGPALH